MLIEAGADVTARDLMKRLPMDVADSKEIRDLLKPGCKRIVYGWEKISDDEVLFKQEVAGRELTEVFNFAVKERMTFIRNLKTDAEAAVREPFFKIMAEQIENAAGELLTLGGADYTKKQQGAKLRM